MRRFSEFIFLLACAPLVSHAEPMIQPPAAERLPKEIVTHGDKRIDNYFWLREKTNAAVQNYLREENAYADRMMASTKPLEEKLYSEMLSHLQEDDISAPVKRGDFYYYTRTEKGRNYRVYCRKHRSLDEKEEVIVDANKLAQGLEFFGIGAFEPSDDNNLVAYTTDTTGYRQFTLHILDLRSGQLLPQTFERVGSVVWSPDNKTLFFSTENEVTKRSDQAHRWEIRSPKSEQIYFEPDELFDLNVARSLDREFLFIHSESKLSTEVRALALGDASRKIRVIQPRGPDHKYFLDHRKGLFYIRTNDRAKNYRIMTAPVGQPEKENWRELIGHDPAVKLEEIELFANYLVLYQRSDGLEQLAVRDLRSGSQHLIKMPEPVYSLELDENPEYHTDTLRYRYTSLVKPNSVFDYDMNSRQASLVKQTPVPGYDSAQYETERVLATASDGTKIPCSVAYKRELRKNGSNPFYLYGYGSYGLSIPPAFRFDSVPLLDRGFVLAIAHIRGGGEMGETWRDQGRMEHKMTTFTDFIACAEHFIKDKYTDSSHLVTAGGSAGGLLMGAVLNLRPDLFQAAIAHVPFVDVLNTMLDASLPLTTSEYIEWGNPNTEAEYKVMKAYSPYDNVRAQAYPAMLVRVSLNDSQVPYWEGAKWVAKLRATKTDSHPLFLKTNMGAGHGGASGRYDHLRDTAFDYAFFLQQLGIAN